MSCVHVPVAQAPTQVPPQPSLVPHATPEGQRGTHTQRFTRGSQVCPEGHIRPVPHEGPPGQRFGTFVPQGTEPRSTAQA